MVLCQAEADALLRRVSGTVGLVARLLYGSGLQRCEVARLRVKAAQADIEMTRKERVALDVLLPLAQAVLNRPRQADRDTHP